MIKKNLKYSNGFILIEVLISIAIFVLFASAMVSMILGSLNLMQKSSDYSFAANLSQEGISAVKAVQKRAWNELAFSKSSINFEDKWLLSGEDTEELIEKFGRYIEFENIYRDFNGDIVLVDNPEAIMDINSFKIKSVIYWKDNAKNLSLITETIITNWESKIWEQNSWVGISGQEIIGEVDGFFDKYNIFSSDYLSLIEISTGTLASSGYLESSAFGPVNEGVFSTISWEEEIEEICVDCQIKVQIKTASDISGSPLNWSSTWCGPEGEDGDESDYFLSNEGELINQNHNGDKWIKYKIILEGDGVNSPKLNNIKLYYK